MLAVNRRGAVGSSKRLSLFSCHHGSSLIVPSVQATKLEVKAMAPVVAAPSQLQVGASISARTLDAAGCSLPMVSASGTGGFGR
jgi:hypothetical protein